MFAYLVIGASAGEMTTTLLSLPDGFRVAAEVAVTPEEHANGLMFRKELKPESGMLFMFQDDERKDFWMKNTFISLDIVFLDSKMRVVRIFHKVPASRSGQSDTEVARVAAKGRYVLELAAGTARKHKLKPGSRIKVLLPLPAYK